MPTEEELEQRITDALDREQELRNARDAICKLEADRLNEIFDRVVKPN
jgi:hypothetical protein